MLSCQPRLRAFHRAHTAAGDEGFALIYAVILILIISLLSTVALTLAINQIKPTQFERKRAQTLDNAQAGIDASLTLMRNAKITGTTVGVPALLPCNSTDHGHVDGAVNGAGNTYGVDIYYFGSTASGVPVDPSGLTLAQVKASTSKLACNAITGGLSSAPTFAYISSTGAAPKLPGVTSATTGNRLLHTVYQFSSSNAHPLGGQISFVTAAGHNDCWDAGTPPTGGGTTVTYQSCLAVGAPSQTWLYRNDLSVQWQGDVSKNLCLDYSGFTRVTGTKTTMTLKPCLGNGTYASAWNSSTNQYPTAAQAYQEFGEGQGFIGVLPQGVQSNNGYTTTLYGDRDSGACVKSVAAGTPTMAEPGDALAMFYPSGGCSGDDNSTNFTTGTGAGAASGDTTGLPSANTGQLVSYTYANRCVDVKDSTPSLGLITFPCHESPNVNNLEQNERFVAPAVGVAGQVTIFRNQFPASGGNGRLDFPTLCLESDHNVSSVDGLGYFVSLATCSNAVSTQQWVFAGSTPTSLADRYTIKDSSGACLTAGAGPPQRINYFDGFYQEQEVYVATCTGADNQKWNAPPGVTNSPLKGFGEDQHS